MTSGWVAKALGYIGNSEGDSSDSLNEDLMVLLQGKNVFNDRIYCYMKIPQERMQELNQRMKMAGGFDLREYGTVIAAGKGIPTRDVQLEVNQEYKIKPINNKD